MNHLFIKPTKTGYINIYLGKALETLNYVEPINQNKSTKEYH